MSTEKPSAENAPANVSIGTKTGSISAGSEPPIVRELFGLENAKARLKEEQRPSRVKGGEASGAARAGDPQRIKRDRRIRDASDSGVAPKKIAAKEGMSPSQVRKILSRDRP